MLECVINVSEGRSSLVLDQLSRAAGACLLDVHCDPYHHRSVFTLAGHGVEAAARRLATTAIQRLDLTGHSGVHPRLGVIDVVPFVPLEGATPADACSARDDFARWIASEYEVPSFIYGPAVAEAEGVLATDYPPAPSLPEVRRDAFGAITPVYGPPTPHPSAGAVCVGARPVLVAYNLWLGPDAELEAARSVARAVRSREVKALALAVGDRIQVSMNLVDPFQVGPAEAFDMVNRLGPVAGAELVGLLPEGVLAAIPEKRWTSLGLDLAHTIEHRLTSLIYKASQGETR